MRGILARLLDECYSLSNDPRVEDTMDFGLFFSARSRVTGSTQ